MALNPTSKNLLLFNAGEYSPFLDNRVDMEKAAGAAKRMENFVCEVEGPAKRRPGLKFVDEIGPAVIVGAVTDYIEFSLMWLDRRHTTGYGSSVFNDLWFQGTVRLWDSGSFQLIGKAIINGYGNTTPNRKFRVWSGVPGDAFNDGTVHDVATLSMVASPTTADWTNIDFAVRAGVGERIHMLISDDQPNGFNGTPLLLFDYPGGFNFPFSTFTVPHDAEIIVTDLERSGNDIHSAGTSGTWLVATNVNDVISYYLDTTVEVSFGVWQFNNAITHMHTEGVADTFDFTRTIPDSETQGLVLFYSAGSALQYGTLFFGPILRPAYAPVVQSGYDPII